MFLCDCPSCGRRELRGPRSLFTVPTPTGAAFAARCRGCAADVHVSGPARTVAERLEPATAA